MENWLLLASGLAALALGPSLSATISRVPAQAIRRVNLAIGAVVAALIVISVIPHTVAESGPWVLIAALAGAGLPLWMERSALGAATAGRRSVRGRLFLAISASGLVVHEALDGAALAGFHGVEDTDHSLGLAVLLHRALFSIALWWMLVGRLGRPLAARALGALGGVTTLGFLAAPAISRAVPPDILGWVEALIAGMLLHVLLHAHGAESGTPAQLQGQNQ